MVISLKGNCHGCEIKTKVEEDEQWASQCLVLIRGWGFTEWQIWHEGCCPSKVMWSGDDTI